MLITSLNRELKNDRTGTAVPALDACSVFLPLLISEELADDAGCWGRVR